MPRFTCVEHWRLFRSLSITGNPGLTGSIPNSFAAAKWASLQYVVCVVVTVVVTIVVVCRKGVWASRDQGVGCSVVGSASEMKLFIGRSLTLTGNGLSGAIPGSLTSLAALT